MPTSHCVIANSYSQHGCLSHPYQQPDLGEHAGYAVWHLCGHDHVCTLVNDLCEQPVCLHLAWANLPGGLTIPREPAAQVGSVEKLPTEGEHC